MHRPPRSRRRSRRSRRRRRPKARHRLRRRRPRRLRRSPEPAFAPRGAMDRRGAYGMLRASRVRGSGETGRRTSLGGWQGQPCGGSNPLCRTTRPIPSRVIFRRRGGTHWTHGDHHAMAQNLEQVARSLVAPGKGILAADESSGTIEKRLKSISTPSTEENRRNYREMLFRTEGAEQFVSGVILYDETIRQNAADGTPLREVLSRKGIQPGIKVDAGTKQLPFSPKEKITEGLDGLRERVAEYRGLGATFAKWRAVITIGDGIPTDACLHTNAHALARYAAI